MTIKRLPAHNATIRRIKRKFELSDKAMGIAIGVAPVTIRSWLRRPTEVSYRVAPEWAAKAALQLESRLQE